MTAKNIKEFKVRINHEHRAYHSLFLKEHLVRDKTQEKPEGRTLFVMNVPPYCNEECLKRLFGEFGKVEAVYIQASASSSVPKKDASKFFPEEVPKKGFQVAYVVFKKSSHLKATLNADETVRFFVEKDNQYVTGIKKWMKEYEERIVSADGLSADVNAYMTEYDRQKAIREAKEREAAEPDDEGWVTVTSKGRQAVNARTEATEENLKKKEKKKTAEKQLVNFYTYQLKQSKMEHIAQLRKKFEEDKKRIQEIKQSRKFRPY